MTYPPQQPPTVHGYPAQPPNNDWPPPAPPPGPAAKKRSPRILVAVAAVAVAAAVIVISMVWPTGADALKDAQGACDPEKRGSTITDGGETLIIDGRSTNNSSANGLPMDGLICMLRELKVPGSVIAQMEGTRALDGRQQAAWDGFSASWSYHPNNGMDVVITTS
jgi:hypothetical protein